MEFVKAVLEYDGSNFCGWQRQKNGTSIQQVFEEALERITGEKKHVRASGRTDAKVHAEGQVVSFFIKSSLKWTSHTLRRALNAVLPKDIVVRDTCFIEPSFDARFSATQKTYRYQIYTGVRSPLCDGRYWFLPYHLSVEPMRLACLHLLGRHDFKCFQASDCQRKDSVRTITQLIISSREHRGNQFIDIRVSGDAFLKNMVRILVGTLVNVARGVYSSDYVCKILEQKDRKLAGQTAPAHGLYLESVEYGRDSLGSLIRPYLKI